MSQESEQYPEPEWTESQPAEEECSSLVSTSITPFILTGIIIRLLQYHFSDPDNILHEELKNYVWKEECTDGTVGETGIMIVPEYNQDFGNVGTRPGIFVKREPVKPERISIVQGDSEIPHMNKVKGVYQGRKYQKQLSGRFSIICNGLNGQETELLGEEVFFRMLHFAPLIRDDVRLSYFNVDNYGDIKERAAGDGTKSYYSVVGIFWALIHRWNIVGEAAILKRIRFNTVQFAET